MSSAIAHIHETGAEILIEVELPEQLRDDEVEVTVLDRTVIVRGGRESDPEGFGKRAGRSTAFRSELQLPATADVDHLRATVRPGMLELRAPRRLLRPRKLAVHRPNLIDPRAEAD